MSAKDLDVLEAIISNIVLQCGCVFTEDHVKERSFQCFPSSPEAVTYRAELHGTREASVQDLLGDMKQWIQGGPSITVQLQLLTVDSSCNASISSLTEPECGVSSDSELSIGATVGLVSGIIVAILLLIVVVAVVIVVVAICKNRQVTLKLNTME